MKFKISIAFCFTLFLISACSQKQHGETITQEDVVQQLQKLSEDRTEAEKNDDLESFMAFYTENAISMPEYQPTLTGIEEIESFYKEIFQRQNIKNFQRKADEIIHLDETIIEIGTFTKEYTDSDADSLLTQNGKYWNVWAEQSNRSYKLKGEIFGFFHHVENQKSLTVQLKNSPSSKSVAYLDQEIPLELRAYNALNENYVKSKAGTLKSDFYTHDAKFMPFADSTVTGIEELKPYFIEYTNRGDITIDSIAVGTFYYEYFDDYVIEYATFQVKWSAQIHSGRTAGKGIRLWKRQEDKSLKLYRHIGSHDYLD